ncbi:hypothetical protein ELI92_31080, partial [Klebsiella pneumoniae]|nr:hypothetical protein [Klebsiella pneumoniae]
MNLVAIGNGSSASKSSVRVPSQRHLPEISGSRITGVKLAAASCEPTGTIGSEKVMLMLFALPIVPSGALRTTVSGAEVFFAG